MMTTTMMMMIMAVVVVILMMMLTMMRRRTTTRIMVPKGAFLDLFNILSYTGSWLAIHTLMLDLNSTSNMHNTAT